MAVVETERHGQILVVRMNRPERLNALSHEMRTLLAETWTEFRHSDELEVAIFTGTGRGFCAGEDMKESLQNGAPGGRRPDIEDPFMSGALEKPVIAAVNGFAMGGGFMLVERTDLRVAVRGAVFEVSEAKRWLLGGYNHGHIANLPYPIAMEMALGFRFTAERFYDIGFLNRLVEPDELMPSALAMAEHLLTLPPASRVNTVHMMRQMRPAPAPEHAAPGRRAARARRQERPDGIARRVRREAQAPVQGLGRSAGPLPAADLGYAEGLTMSTHDPVRFVAKNMRVDLRLIAEMIAPGARVLDIGCGDGMLIDHLFRTKGCDARGIEIDMAEVTRAVAHGLPVMHGDADIDLAHYPDGAFDYVVLSRTLQAVERPRAVLRADAAHRHARSRQLS